MRSIGLPELIVIAGVGTLCLVPFIFYLLTLQRSLDRCSPQSRTISPGKVWLLFIPLFNLAWQFVVVTGIARSLANEYRLRGIPLKEPEPGKGIGLAMCILACTSIIPLLGIVTGIAAFLCWIIYWVKISDYSAQLATPIQYVQPPGAPPQPWA